MSPAERDVIEVVDLEEYACSGKPIPKYVKYFKIRVDKEKYNVQSPITTEGICAVAGLDPKDYHLQQKFCEGKRKKLEPGQEIDLRESGVERFESVPKEACNG